MGAKSDEVLGLEHELVYARKAERTLQRKLIRARLTLAQNMFEEAKRRVGASWSLPTCDLMMRMFLLQTVDGSASNGIPIRGARQTDQEWAAELAIWLAAIRVQLIKRELAEALADVQR